MNQTFTHQKCKKTTFVVHIGSCTKGKVGMYTLFSLIGLVFMLLILTNKVYNTDNFKKRKEEDWIQGLKINSKFLKY
jgi:hypothetical protein